LAFAVSAIVILGFAGLGTEVGIWYLVRRQAQGAADAASIAGALAAYEAIASCSGADPSAAAVAAANLLFPMNGFSAGGNTLGTVTIVPPTYLSPYTSPTGATGTTYPCPTGVGKAVGAVEVTVKEAMIPLMSSMFGGTGPTDGARSVALVEPINYACALTLTGDLTVSGTVGANVCGLASNATDDNAISVAGTFAGLTLTAVGGCGAVANCGPGTVSLTQPAAPYHPPTPNPFIGADAIVFPAFAGGTCAPPPTAVAGVIQLTPYETSGKAYCSDITLAASQTLQFGPGTYIFYNASLTASAGTIQCLGCSAATSGVSATPGAGLSIVFLGTGTPTIVQNAVVCTLYAPPANAAFAALSGILFYGRGISPATISLQNPPTCAKIPKPGPINGGVYFPNATLNFTGNPTSQFQSVCLPLVADTMVLTGTFTFALDPAQCPHFNTPMLQMQGARVVE